MYMLKEGMFGGLNSMHTIEALERRTMMTALTFIIDRLWLYQWWGLSDDDVIQMVKNDCKLYGIDWDRVARANYPTG